MTFYLVFVCMLNKDYTVVTQYLKTIIRLIIHTNLVRRLNK